MDPNVTPPTVAPVGSMWQLLLLYLVMVGAERTFSEVLELRRFASTFINNLLTVVSYEERNPMFQLFGVSYIKRQYGFNDTGYGSSSAHETHQPEILSPKGATSAVYLVLRMVTRLVRGQAEWGNHSPPNPQK